MDDGLIAKLKLSNMNPLWQMVIIQTVVHSNKDKTNSRIECNFGKKKPFRIRFIQWMKKIFR